MAQRYEFYVLVANTIPSSLQVNRNALETSHMAYLLTIIELRRSKTLFIIILFIKLCILTNLSSNANTFLPKRVFAILKNLANQMWNNNNKKNNSTATSFLLITIRISTGICRQMILHSYLKGCLPNWQNWSICKWHVTLCTGNLNGFVFIKKRNI